MTGNDHDPLHFDRIVTKLDRKRLTGGKASQARRSCQSFLMPPEKDASWSTFNPVGFRSRLLDAVRFVNRDVSKLRRKTARYLCC